MQSLSMFNKLIAVLAASLILATAQAQTAPAQPLKPNQNPLMTTPRPLFFQDIVALDTSLHRTLTLPLQRTSFAFAGQANVLPLTFAEVGQALHHYPVVFVADGNAVSLVALTDLQPGSNRFVDAKGAWRAGAYIPAYVRGYPFISIRVADKAEPLLALDPQAADFKAPDGQKLLLADGQPSELLKGIMAFQGEYRQLAERTHAMVQALQDANVLEEGSLQLQPTAGGEPQKIGGFMVVSESKLKALPADALKKLMDADALGLAYAQMFSMGSLGNVFAQPVQDTETSMAPVKAASKRAAKKAQ
jgi:hypothetical protein